MPTLTYDTVNGYHCAEHGKGYCEHWKAIGNSKPARKEVMDLTKLVERIPHSGYWPAGADPSLLRTERWPEVKGFKHDADCLRCAFDADLAAVPQDTVEAVREAVAHAIKFDVKESDGARWEYPDSEFAALMDAIEPAIRSALAARPVRAVLTEEQVAPILDPYFRMMDAYQVELGRDLRVNRSVHTAQVTAALNAALDRQHAEPPADATTDSFHLDDGARD